VVVVGRGGGVGWVGLGAKRCYGAPELAFAFASFFVDAGPKLSRSSSSVVGRGLVFVVTRDSAAK
jgi:hypothetical protein